MARASGLRAGLEAATRALLFRGTWFEEHPTCSVRPGSGLAAPLLSLRGLLLGSGSADVTVGTLQRQTEESVSVGDTDGSRPGGGGSQTWGQAGGLQKLEA